MLLCVYCCCGFALLCSIIVWYVGVELSELNLTDRNMTDCYNIDPTLEELIDNYLEGMSDLQFNETTRSFILTASESTVFLLSNMCSMRLK